MGKFSLKSIAEPPLTMLLKRLDFVRQVRKLAVLEPGASYLADPRRRGVPAFDDQEQIARLAVDLTERAYQEKGDTVNHQEIKSHVQLISCRYEHRLHEEATAACYNIISDIFDHRDPGRLFTSADLRELRFLPQLLKAQQEGIGIVYLINHSSHFDEFIFNTFIDQNGLAMPLFAAGQNMMATPSLTRLFMLGSYVIVRKGASRSYLSSLFHYCQALAEMGKPQGIFLEAWSGGARTRDGSLRYPRRLVTIQGALASRGDVFIQPVVISYSLVPEDRDLSEGRGLVSWFAGHNIFREVLKKPWAPLAGMARGLRGLLGRSYIGFGRGRLLSDIRSEWEGTPRELALDEFATLYAIKEIARDKKIMTTHLAALALDGLPSPGRDREALEASARKAMETISGYHQRVFDLEPDFEDAFRDLGLPAALNDGLDSLARRGVVADRGPKWQKSPKIRSNHALSYYATHSDRRLYSPSAQENLVVCGAGQWGFALVTLVGRRTINDKKFHNSSLSLYDPSEDLVHGLAYERTLAGYPEVRLPKNVFPTSDHMEAFRKATEVVVATPPEEVGELLKTILAYSTELRTLILASRGFERLSHRLTIQMAWEAAVAAGKPKLNIVALAGPFEPQEVLADKGGLFVVAGRVKGGRTSEASLFKFGNYKVHLTDDPVGVQTASAMITAYSFYGAHLRHQKELRAPSEMADYVRCVSFEAKTLAMALGGQPSTFEADSPAWVSGLITSSLTIANLPSVKILVNKGVEAFKDHCAERPFKDQWPDQGLEGYYAIHSAHMIAKHLSLSLPHLERANEVFWG
ncbi:MAG: 1-acyl-sn-glycerol-3-phosphate acyltransferase [Deltaproteobacteria bacterium]|jgi:glycerol-3-phosphate dehydrogenase|nr:1-acyl-sn-glycerol-3-phosphate acyltransferase [Deltaproteobacteria bacterium]